MDQSDEISIPHMALRPRRVGICGSSPIDAENAAFCHKLGWELAGDEGMIIVTGGFRHSAKEPHRPSADWSIVQGAMARLAETGISPETRIETLLPEKDLHGFVRFEIGKIHVVRRRSPQARRFVLVNAVDVLVAVAGVASTREEIDLALALVKPCLPLPFTGGISEKRWSENKELIQEWFQIDDDTAAALETARVTKMDAPSAEQMARRVKRFLLGRLKRKCFVMMPFSDEYLPLYDQAIRPAVEAQGFSPIRTDNLNLVGNAVRALRSAINACDCAVAVITGNNPNVLYELGLAHAHTKPTILLTQRDPSGQSVTDLPFDLRNEYVVPYGQDLGELQSVIRKILGHIVGT